MRENRTSGSMRGCRKRAITRRACALLYGDPILSNAFAGRELTFLLPSGLLPGVFHFSLSTTIGFFLQEGTTGGASFVRNVLACKYFAV